jgi:chromosome segregation ATPase
LVHQQESYEVTAPGSRSYRWLILTNFRRDLESIIVNCPKCGFAQEERADCLKCGVVFAKYYALYPLDSATPVELTEIPEVPPAVAVDPPSAELDELHRIVLDLSRRFNELDFERIERSRQRNEIRALEQKVEAQLALMTRSLADQEQKIVELPARKDLEDLKAGLHNDRIEPILHLLAQMEDRLTAVQNEVSTISDPRILEAMKKLDKRQADLEGKLTDLFPAGNGEEESASAARIGPVLRAIDELRESLQNVTVRYSEIGELKKNHLVLLSRLESLEQDFNATGQEAFKNLSGKLAELDKEVSALRAEVRQAIARTEMLQAPHAPQALEVEPLKEQLAELHKVRTDESEKLRSALGALESKLNESILSLAWLPDRVQSLAGQIQRVEQRYQRQTDESDPKMGDGMAAKAADLDNSISVLRQESLQLQARLQSVEAKIENVKEPSRGECGDLSNADMQAIRENLEEIRRFMTVLQQKF